MQVIKYNLHIIETDFLRTAACTWKAIWFGGCHVGGLESQHADGVLSRTHLKAKNVLGTLQHAVGAVPRAFQRTMVAVSPHKNTCGGQQLLRR